ncbi:MAG: GNAT family N-acetyltransferase [Planctomycetaceae bacterium]|nr:GNAT family N-acetyltransferase [Planctomycetaceae bacterium]
MVPLLRTLSRNDLAAMHALEQIAWPSDVQACTEKLLDRLTTFQEGCFGAFDCDELLGMVTSQIVYLPTDRYPTWTELTSDGWISKSHDPVGDCLHFVSICVHPARRGRGIGRQLNRCRLDLARRLGMRGALTHVRLPGLGSYLVERPSASPHDYVNDVISGRILEPAVRMYENLGFSVVRLTPECMRSDRESLNYGLIMVAHLDENHASHT